MRSGFNPTRRNRNIGTAKRGHGQANRLVIPEICRGERSWSAQLNPHQVIRRDISGREVVFIVETTRAGCLHACSVEDVCQVLRHVPMVDWEAISTFVFRQPTRKQMILQPAWGRMYYSADLGLPGRKAMRFGPAVLLEAVNCDAKLTWPSALGPQGQAELERLRGDGHEIQREGNHYRVSMTADSVRATQLYRTLLHEIGHWVDYLTKVEQPVDQGLGDYEKLADLYFARPSDEREAFANRYADTMRAKLAEFGIVPFDRITGVPPSQVEPGSDAHPV